MTEDELVVIYDVASKNAPPSIGWGILVDHLGFLLVDTIGDYVDDLVQAEADLTGLTALLAEEVLRLANDNSLAPFDGTLAEQLEDGDTEQDWLVREDLLPFVKNWSANVRGIL